MKGTICILVLTYLSIGIYGQKNLDDKLLSIFGNTTTNNNNGEIENRNPDTPKIPDGRTCLCVPYYLCTKNNTINTDGVGIIDISGAPADCDSYLEVCCNSTDQTKNPIYPPPVPHKGCGYRNPYGIDYRIPGARDQFGEAKFGEFPWMVAVLAEEFNAETDSIRNVYKCGGALIHPQAVVTAAHCVSAREKKYNIRVGEWDTQTTKELYPHQDRQVKSIEIHEDYYAGTLLNNIAILFLEDPVNITETVNTLCLPNQDVVIPKGTRCYVSGWGKDVFGKEGKYQVILMKIDLPIVERDTCQEQLRTTRLGVLFNLDKSFVCAGGEVGKDTCKGDAGSPLACPIPGEPGRYQHVGMVAWGIGCGENKIPNVYVNVAMFRHWIDEHMLKNGLDLSNYQY